jgi:lambda family phage portal protein
MVSPNETMGRVARSWPIVSVDDMAPAGFNGQNSLAPSQTSIFDGDKFAGGFGVTQLQIDDIWTMRQRSNQLFNQNLYAKGLIRRLVTNEINTGITPEACPDEGVLGLEPDSLVDWTDNVENRWALWGKTPQVCDWQQEQTWGAIQQVARREALIWGDLLIVLRRDKATKLPSVQLILADRVANPLAQGGEPKKGNVIEDGVEFDKRGRQVAFWVQQEDLSFTRIAARSRRGLLQAWMIYGSDRRANRGRGQPLLTAVLQCLQEIDRYRDASLRKAVVNSIVAMFIQKDNQLPGTLPITGAAKRNASAVVSDSDGKTRNFNVASLLPGVVMEELQTGEKPVAFRDTATGDGYGEFEAAIIQAIGWTNQIPPEILTLAFSNNYSASQAAINEFKIYLNMFWESWGDTVCAPVYSEWLVTADLLGEIDAPGLFEATLDPAKYATQAAWLAADWYGSIKPSTDTVKAAKGAEKLIELGLTTRAREARQITGTKFGKNMRRQRRENEQLVEVRKPIFDMEHPPPPPAVPKKKE